MLTHSCASTQVNNWEGVTVTGRIVDAVDQPVQNAYIYAYVEGRTNTMGPADVMSEPTSPDGTYLLVLPRGSYILVARKRLSGSISGPLKKGDMSGHLSRPYSADRGGSGVDIEMKAFRHGVEGDPKRILTTNTRVAGVVVDVHGAVLPAMNVFAYKGSFRTDPPDYMAASTDTKGRFEISLPGAGDYTIGARTGLGGKPGPDEKIGFWGDKYRPRVIEEGTIVEGVKIVVKPYNDTVTR